MYVFNVCLCLCLGSRAGSKKIKSKTKNVYTFLFSRLFVVVVGYTYWLTYIANMLLSFATLCCNINSIPIPILFAFYCVVLCYTILYVAYTRRVSFLSLLPLLMCAHKRTKSELILKGSPLGLAAPKRNTNDGFSVFLRRWWW